MAGLLKSLRLPYYKDLRRRMNCFISNFCHFRRLIIPSAVMMIYVSWQFIQKLIFDSSLRTSVQQFPELEPLVTVIVTVYNVQPFIQTAIRAVLAQTYSNLEVIVIDDASTDKSISYSKQVTQNDKRVKYLSLPENSLGGVGVPTNVALEQARGKYIALVDGDDFPAANFISRMLTLSLKLDLDICICKFRSFENVTLSKEEYDLLYWPKPGILAESKLRALHPLEVPNIFKLSPEPWRKLYKKEFLEYNNIRFPEGDFFFEDNAFHWFVLRQTRRVSFIDEELIWHRENRRGQTTDLKKEDIQIHHEIAKKSKNLSQKTQKKYYVSASKYFVRASHFLNINSVGQDIRKCEERGKYCKVAKTHFLMWIYRHKWLLALVGSLDNKKIWKKFASIYIRTLVYWSSQFKTSYLDIPPRRRRIPQEISQVGEAYILVSIVVYCRNIERFLSGTDLKLEVFNRKVEFIFLEDSSEDLTLEKLAGIEERYNNVFVIHTAGRGSGKAFNTALPLCEGKYVAFLNYDTFADLFILQRILQAAESHLQDVIVLSQAKLNNDEEIRSQRRIERHMNESVSRDWIRDGSFESKSITEMRRFFLRDNTNKITVVSRELILQKSIFFGGSGIEDTLQYNWNVLLFSKSVIVLPIRRNLIPKYGTLNSNTTRTKRYFKTLNVLLNANRVLLKNGITEDKAYHKDWKMFCARRMVQGRLYLSNRTITRYDRESSLALKIIESNKDTIHVE